MPGQPLHVLIAAAKESESSLYEDDGHAPPSKDRKFMRRTFSQVRGDRVTTIEVSAPEGSYRPAPRDLVLEKCSVCEPKAVSLETGNNPSRKITVPQLAADAMTNSACGWSFTNGLLTVKQADSFMDVRCIVDR